MWIKIQKPYIWDRELRLRLDIGFILFHRIPFPCGEILQDSSTGLSTRKTGFYLVHILERFQNGAHIWGCQNMDNFSLIQTSPQRRAFIHKKSRVIHKYRAKKRGVGEIPATKCGVHLGD